MAGQDRILWLTDTTGLSDKTKFALNIFLRKEGLSLAQIYFVCVRTGQSDPKNLDLGRVQTELDKYITTFKPKIIVCNDELTLRLFAGKRANLFMSRGSIYCYSQRENPHVYTVLCIDTPANWHNVWIKQSGKKMFVPGKWVLTNDVQKLARWVNGKQRKQPKFVYKICRDIHDLREADEFLDSAIAIAGDIETHPGRITVVGYCGLLPDGTVKTYVIPFYNPFKPNNAHWDEQLEYYAWKIVRRTNANAATKIFQGGGYDASYFIRYGCPLSNWDLDLLHLWHSVFTEAPKKLNFIASILLDYCRYWKDESKGDEKTSEHKGKFRNAESYERYLRYNALDCYNTLCAARVMVAIVKKLDWAISNYVTEFSLQVGPALAMTMRGMRYSQERLDAKEVILTKEMKEALAAIRIMADDPEFNPNSPNEFAHLLYTTLGAKMPKLKGKAKQKLKEQSVDKSVLRMVATQHPLIEAYIEKVQDVKEPKNDIAKYCRIPYFNNRLYYTMDAAGTETGRFASRRHPFKLGTQVQNVKHGMRDYIIADEGTVLFEPDYSQSDARFVAYESQDPRYIANVESGKDTHCLHAAHFFRPMTFEQILEGVKKKDPYFVHEPTGIRPITKRIVHGKNYNMAGFTLYMLMGKKAVIAAAKAKGHADAGLWSDDRYASFCQSLLNDYDNLYTRLKPWQKEEMEKGRKNGNKITCAGGRTRLFFGDLSDDKDTQREAIAYYGQGGTAGIINRTIKRVYYKEREFNGSARLHTQTHDSILFAITLKHGWNFVIETAEKILTIMNEPVTIHGRELRVPTDAKIGFSWSEGCLKFKSSITEEELWHEQRKLDEKYRAILAEAEREAA